MKHIKNAFLLLALFTLSCESSKEVNPPQHHELSSNINEYFNQLTKIKKFNGAILLQKDGEIILSKTYNMKEAATPTLRVKKQSQFDIHSISKLMGQAAVVKLEGRNLIDRTDKVSKYIQDFPKGELITIQHLIDNESGLPRKFSKDYPNLISKSPAEVVELIKDEKFLFEPGTESVYSNLGYQVLYFIVSKITGKPFVQYLEDEFFKPLDMNHTGAHFHLKKDNLKSLVKNHEKDDDKIEVIPNIEKDGKNQAKIYSTNADLLKFINHVKKEPYRSQMERKNVIGWSGGGDGIFCHASAHLESEYELVFFSNYDDIPFGTILSTVEKIMTKQTYEMPKEINRKAIKLQPSDMEKYLGKYLVKDFNSGIFEFRIEKDSMIFYQNGERNTVLFAENDSTFFYGPREPDYFQFRKESKEEFKMIFMHKNIPFEGKKVSNKRG